MPIFDADRDYLAEETRRVKEEVSQILKRLEDRSKSKEVTRSPSGVKTNTSIDVLRLQKNIDNWTIQVSCFLAVRRSSYVKIRDFHFQTFS